MEIDTFYSVSDTLNINTQTKPCRKSNHGTSKDCSISGLKGLLINKTKQISTQTIGVLNPLNIVKLKLKSTINQK